MLQLLLNDIKKLFLRPFISVLLILGLTVASAAGIIYFSYASTSLNIRSTMFMQDKVIEVRSNGDARSESEVLLDLFERGELPPAVYVTAISYTSSNYDLIGYKEYERYLEVNRGGEYLDKSDEGSMNAVVTQNFLGEDEMAKPGDTITLNGRDFTVKGTTNFTQYTYERYDFRRMPEGQEFVAGMDFSLERDEETKNRPDKVAIVPMDQYLNITDMTSLFHITFKDSFTNEQREQLEQIISDNTGLCSFIPITVFQNTNSVTQWANAAAYLVAILAGIINIIGLFTFFLRENRQQYAVYRLLGATRSYVVAVILAELFVFTLFSYFLACIIAVTTLKLGADGIFKYVSIPSIGSFMLIFLFIYIGSILISFPQIRAIVMPKKPRRHKKDQFIAGVPNGAKGAYLLSFQYGKRNFSGVFSTIALSLVVSLCFTYTMTYVFEGNKFMRYYEQNYSSELAVISFDDEKMLKIGNDTVYGEQPDVYTNDAYTEIIGAISDLSYVKGYCMNPVESCFIMNEAEGWEGQFLEFDLNYLKNVKLPLSKGKWEDMLSYDPTDENAVIPCVVNPSMEGEIPYGSEFTLTISFPTGMIEAKGSFEDGSFEGKVSADDFERRFKVGGVISNEAYISQGCINCYGGFPDITDCLKSVSNMRYDFFTPVILHNSKRLYTYNEPDFMLILDKNVTQEQKDELKEVLREYAQVDYFKDAIDKYNEMFTSGGGEVYIMHSVIAGLLLLFGIGGFTLVQFSLNKRTYGVYYACGMRWAQASRLMLTANGINTLIPAAIGGVLGIVLATVVRGSFAPLSIVLSVGSGIAAVGVVYLIISVFSSIYIKREQPKNLLSEDAK